MGDEFDDVEAMLEAPFRKGGGIEVRKVFGGVGLFSYIVPEN